MRGLAKCQPFAGMLIDEDSFLLILPPGMIPGRCVDPILAMALDFAFASQHPARRRLVSVDVAARQVYVADDQISCSCQHGLSSPATMGTEIISIGELAK